MRRILVTGKNGQVGWELQRTLMTLGEVIAVDRTQMDLADADSIRNCIREVKPNLIVNAAAYTAVDKAESEVDLAMAINGLAPGIMAEEAKRLGAAIVHYSTDYVFDGTKTGPYTEDDTPRPLSIYGKSKLAGEEAIKAVGCPHLTLRTSWVYGARGKNFLRTILKLAKERPELRVVNDQVGAPTWCRHLAEATVHILAQLYSPAVYDPARVSDVSGTYHLTTGGRTTWFGFATEIMNYASLANEPMPELLPIPSEHYLTAAKRPKNSLLSNGKLVQRFGLTQPDWAFCLRICLAELSQ